jgi:P4 family phage/plasmid primase-like protien
LVQQGCEQLGEGAKLGTVNAAWKRLNEHPGLHRHAVAWDRHGLVATANGALELRTQALTAWSPDHFLRRKLAVAYDPARRCPQFLKFLDVLVANREPAVRKDLVALLQEAIGACLGTPLLNREQRRALLLKGPSRTGKTELAKVIRLLVGEPVASPAACDIGERFGMATFHGACAWIRDDAVNEGDKINPERFKTIVTGEPIDIERKNRPPLRQVRLDIPVVLTANSLPTSRDSSDAIFNRSLVVELTHELSEEFAQEERQARSVPAGQSLGEWIFAQEGPGILNWALDGLHRLLARGRYSIPETVCAAIQAFKDDSNPVAEWARTMVERADGSKVSRGDLLCAFHGWWREEMGDDVRLLGGRWLVPKLRAACPYIDTSVRSGDVRYIGGIKLTGEGLKYWSRQSTDAAQRGHGSRGTASSAADVNRVWSEDNDD